MTRIRFFRQGQLIGTIDAHAGESLLDVARVNDLPLHWRCGQGTCGTCVVRLRHAGQPVPVEVGRKERNVLLRAGRIDTALAAQATWVDEPASLRLACHLLVTAVDWDVELPAAE